MTALPPPPPPLEALPAGYQLAAGLGVATVLPDIDVETYSEAGYLWDEGTGKWACLPNAPQGKMGISVVGAAVYAEHPTCEMLSLAYDLKEGLGKRFWRQGLPPPYDLWAHVLQGGLLEAFNANFEYWIWHHVAHRRMGWPKLHPWQLRCAMAKGRSWQMPGALAHVGEVLDLAVQKDVRGKALLNKFSVPRNPTKTDPRRRIRPLWTLEDVEREVETYRKGLTACAA